MRKALVCLVALGLTACASTQERGERQPPEELARYVATGEFENCISISRIKRSRPLDDYTILFTMRGGTVYVNQLPYRCAQLGFEKRFSYSTFINRLCSTEIITVFSPTIGPITSCGLGRFERLEPKENAAEQSTETPPDG